ncbi:DUF7008 domain-containing protein [Streptomyces pini]|uniref:DUF7008 domain-containing protein n=1 Tax=Streptomyces pini TaxID=1520580 RepID=A0A1I3Z3L0_9ACTN|nr:hypothetical protein [Streptomyces pini]SFK38637.1 hypothetical protein SAMN05192584_105308 [Streptomyces pini]
MWRDERVRQSAAAWVLGCVFVRFCEDNGLIDEPFIAGPGERLAEAEARHWSTERIVPLLAGLREVMPWAKQWHGEYDDEWGDVPADELEAEYENLLRRNQVGEQELAAWRPVRKQRGRKPARKAAPDGE